MQVKELASDRRYFKDVAIGNAFRSYWYPPRYYLKLYGDTVVNLETGLIIEAPNGFLYVNPQVTFEYDIRLEVKEKRSCLQLCVIVAGEIVEYDNKIYFIMNDKKTDKSFQIPALMVGAKETTIVYLNPEIDATLLKGTFILKPI